MGSFSLRMPDRKKNFTSVVFPACLVKVIQICDVATHMDEPQQIGNVVRGCYASWHCKKKLEGGMTWVLRDVVSTHFQHAVISYVSLSNDVHIDREFCIALKQPALPRFLKFKS